MFQSEMSDLTLGLSPELLLLGHEEEIDNQVNEIMLQDFNNFQNVTNADQIDGLKQEDLMDETMEDMFYLSAKPSDITGQSLAYTMQQDKNKVLNNMAIQPFYNEAITVAENKPDMAQELSQHGIQSAVVKLQQQSKEATSSLSNGQNEIQETQEVIEEIQEFLDLFVDKNMEKDEEGRNLADELLSLEQKQTLQSMEVLECPMANSTMNDEETSAAENLLDQLLSGSFTDQEIKQLEQQSVSVQNDTGYSSSTPLFDVSNVSEIVTDDGRKVFIVITPSSGDEVIQAMTMTTPSTVVNVSSSFALPSNVVSSETSGINDVVSEEDGNNSSGDDSEWLPETEVTTRRFQSKAANTTAKNKPGRKQQERTKLNASTSSKGQISKLRSIQDKKERKRLQNVDAARRYRDKKKSTEALTGVEEKALQQRQEELQTTLNGIQGELSTLKGLMKELGLIKFVTPSSRSRVQ